VLLIFPVFCVLCFVCLHPVSCVPNVDRIIFENCRYNLGIRRSNYSFTWRRQSSILDVGSKYINYFYDIIIK
jgi:hypothetical protein